MLLSTAIPIVIAAIVIVIISKGILRSPIIPRIKNAAMKLGTTPIKDKVIAYVACSGRTTTHPTYPSDEYRDFIINGATQHDLPGKYITKIEELASPNALQILRDADAAWEASKK